MVGLTLEQESQVSSYTIRDRDTKQISLEDARVTSKNLDVIFNQNIIPI